MSDEVKPPVIQKLKGASNWHEWRELVEAFLWTKDLWCVVSREEQAPLDLTAAEYNAMPTLEARPAARADFQHRAAEYHTRQRKAAAYIRLYLDGPHLTQVQGLALPADIWADLSRTYAPEGHAQQMYHRRVFGQLSLKKEESIAQYVARARAIRANDAKCHVLCLR